MMQSLCLAFCCFNVKAFFECVKYIFMCLITRRAKVQILSMQPKNT